MSILGVVVVVVVVFLTRLWFLLVFIGFWSQITENVLYTCTTEEITLLPQAHRLLIDPSKHKNKTRIFGFTNFGRCLSGCMIELSFRWNF
jgi:hypothetical protein